MIQKLRSNIQIEDRADTNGAKEADIDSLSGFFNLVDFLVHGENDWGATEEQDEDSEGDETVDGDYVVVDEFVPGADGAEPDED